MSPVLVSISRLPPVTRSAAGSGRTIVVHRQPSTEDPSNSSFGVAAPAVSSGTSWNQSNAASTTGRLPVPVSAIRPMRGLVIPATILSVCGIAVHDSPSAEYDAVSRVPSLASRT